jgi:peroxiredoxin
VKVKTMPTTSELSFDEAIRTFPCHDGHTLVELSADHPVLTVFLRHAGCAFCREALSDLQKQRSKIEAAGTSMALVHMVSNDEAVRFFRGYGLDDVPRFSDPGRKLYQAFDLHRGNLWQLIGPSVFWRGMKAFFSGHGAGRIRGDVAQLPGTFVLHRGQIVQAFRNKTAADRPEYAAMVCAVPSASK